MRNVHCGNPGRRHPIIHAPPCTWSSTGAWASSGLPWRRANLVRAHRLTAHRQQIIHRRTHGHRPSHRTCRQPRSMRRFEQRLHAHSAVPPVRFPTALVHRVAGEKSGEKWHNAESAATPGARIRVTAAATIAIAARDAIGHWNLIFRMTLPSADESAHAPCASRFPSESPRS